MTEDERWSKVRQIVREENEALLAKILSAVATKAKTKLELVNGRWVGVTEDQMNAWREAFPAVDIDGELKKMAAWIVSNPVMAPKSQVGRFVNSWLTKSQNMASLRSIPTERKTEVKLKLCAYCDKVGADNVNGRWACADHFRDALDNTPIPHMRGIVAKPVAGS